MSLCHEYHLPHSKYLRWNPEDRDKALAYLAYRGALCPKCGTDPDDWLDEEGKVVEPLPYEARSAKCHGCVTLEEARARVDDKTQSGTINHSLRRVPRKLAEKVQSKWQMISR